MGSWDKGLVDFRLEISDFRLQIQILALGFQISDCRLRFLPRNIRLQFTHCRAERADFTLRDVDCKSELLNLKS